ncbi:TIGR03086 family protein [Nocardioides dongxiaopingii]|uniref:TIGR03086 family metal-binding protein n=1 Tax=Nocardioides sp. S-1144 TaxID=2582905 RepID=UPI001163AACA|nr:TIGR03086 family metal-binding protein [Nocardioides sp. S-1144]QDH10610.1 TIGR03086 family protein [Nocardioides sp. S-1144]
MSDELDLTPTARELARLVRGTREDQLGHRTPCPAYTVADLVDHVRELTVAFTRAATKEPATGDAAPGGGAARSLDAVREEVAAGLDRLAAAWAEPAAYEGRTWAGPVELSAPEAALVALDEITVHAWDLAVATGQEYAADPAAVEACTGFAASFVPPAGALADDAGLFGPPVAVAEDASPLDRLVGLTGRDPGWGR